MPDEDIVGKTPAEGWRFRKDKDTVNQHKLNAALASRNVSESAEPLWLQFDDDLVEPIPPRNVVSEMAYVFFYRLRGPPKLTPLDSSAESVWYKGQVGAWPQLPRSPVLQLQSPGLCLK